MAHRDPTDHLAQSRNDRALLDALCEDAGQYEPALAICILNHELRPTLLKSVPGHEDWDVLAFQLAWTAARLETDTVDLARHVHDETEPWTRFYVTASPLVRPAIEIRQHENYVAMGGGAPLYCCQVDDRLVGSIGVVLKGTGCHWLIAQVRDGIAAPLEFSPLSVVETEPVFTEVTPWAQPA